MTACLSLEAFSSLFLERGVLYSENSFIWEKDKNNIFDICLALIPDENYTGYSIVLYKKGHNNSAITQEPLFIQAVESPKKTTAFSSPLNKVTRSFW